MSELTIPTGSSNSLVSRLDRLDFLMKYLQRRTKFEGVDSNYNTNTSLYGSGGVDRNGCVPMDLALKEVQFKGALVDRVAALESRIFQLCSDLESSSTSRASLSGTCSSGDTSSQRSRGDSSCSLPTFNHPNPNPNPSFRNARISHVHVMTTTHEIEENTDIEKQNHPNSAKQKLRKNKPTKDGKPSKSGKKRAFRWPRFRLLGCS